jgi:hypothetical protein
MDKTKEQVGKTTRALSEDYQKNMMESSGYATAQMKANYQDLMATTQKFGVGKIVDGWSANMQRYLSESEGAFGNIKGISGSMAKGQLDSLALRQRDMELQKQITTERRDSIKIEMEANEKRYKALSEQTVKTVEEQNEQEALNKVLNSRFGQRREFKALEDEITAIEGQQLSEQIKLIGMMGPDAVAEQLKVQKDLLKIEEDKGKEIAKNIAQNEKDRQDTIKERKKLKLLIDQTEAAEDKNSTINIQRLAELKDKYEELKNLNIKRHENDVKMKTELEEQNKEFERQKDIQEQILKTVRNRFKVAGDADAIISHFTDRSWKGIANVLDRTFHNAAGSFKVGFNDFTTKLGKTAKGMYNAIKNAGKAFIEHPIQNSAKMVGGLVKKLGILALIMGLVSKIFKPLGDTVGPVIEDLFASLSEVFMPLFNTITKKLLPSLLKAAAAIVPILINLVKLVANLLTPIGWIVKGLGHLPGLGFFDAIGDGILSMKEGIDSIDGDEIGKELLKASVNMQKQTVAVNKNTDELEKGNEEKGPAQIRTDGNTLYRMDGSVTGKSSADPLASTTANSSAETAAGTRQVSNNTENMVEISKRNSAKIDDIIFYIKGVYEKAQASEAAASTRYQGNQIDASTLNA